MLITNGIEWTYTNSNTDEGRHAKRLEKATSLEKNFLNGLGNLPLSTYTTYPNSHVLSS